MFRLALVRLRRSPALQGEARWDVVTEEGCRFPRDQWPYQVSVARTLARRGLPRHADLLSWQQRTLLGVERSEEADALKGNQKPMGGEGIGGWKRP